MIRGVLPTMMATGVMLTLTSCLDEGKSDAEKEITGLKENLDILHRDFDAQRERTREVERELSEVRSKLIEAENTKIHAENQLASAQRELEQIRQRTEQERTRPQSPSEQIEAAKEKVGTALESVVTIEGDELSGRGLLVADGDTRHILLPTAMVAANSRIAVVMPGGERISNFSNIELASRGGLARLPIGGDGPPGIEMPASQALDPGARVFGMSAAGTTVDGRVYQSPDGGVTTDQAVSAGGPGSPVFHGQTGELVGLVGHAAPGGRDLWSDAANTPAHAHQQPALEMAAQGVEWTTLPLAGFLEESRQMADFDAITRLVHAFAAIPPTADGVPFDNHVAGSALTARQILAKHSDQQTVRELIDLGKQVAERRMRMSDSDMRRRFGGIYNQLEAASKRQSATFAARRFSPYNEAAARQSIEWRKLAEERLAETIAGIGN